MSCCCPFFQGEGTAELGLGGPNTWEVEDEWNGEEESGEEEEIVPKGDLGTRATYNTNCLLQSHSHTCMGMRLEFFVISLILSPHTTAIVTCGTASDDHCGGRLGMRLVTAQLCLLLRVQRCWWKLQ